MQKHTVEKMFNMWVCYLMRAYYIWGKMLKRKAFPALNTYKNTK